MNITRYNPFDFAAVQALRLLDQALPHASEPSTSRPWTPAVDILETENDLVIKADLPEVKQERCSRRKWPNPASSRWKSATNKIQLRSHKLGGRGNLAFALSLCFEAERHL